MRLSRRACKRLRMDARTFLLLLLLYPPPHSVPAQGAIAATNASSLGTILSQEIVGPVRVLGEVQDYLEPRVPVMPALGSASEWTRYAEQLRDAVLKRVALRGAAAQWVKRPLKVEWLETIPGGPGYHIRKLRYEAAPGFWIPALLYQPDAPAAKMPVVMNVSGHDPIGKAAVYKQVHCINQVKRGMLALNVEWIGMGQLRYTNYLHARMNQLDLCGTSGLAPFYLSLARGLDVLLFQPYADPWRVAVTGYSGGGWQTIFISALDPRVTLANPVAGYSSFRTRIRHQKDLGDPEQTPCDLATLADYTHLTAIMAPRATLLTFNAKDDCCFEAGYALPPLLDAAQLVFRLLGAEGHLRSHVNVDPGTHNYEQDNREAFYRMAGDRFFPRDSSFDAHEIPCASEVKTKEQLDVALPQPNADFNSLALALSQDLPRVAKVPSGGSALREWRRQQRSRLRETVKAKDYTVTAAEVAVREQTNNLQATHWRLRVGNAWTLPATELVRGQPQAVTLVIADAGRRSVAGEVDQLLATGQRVVAIDPFYFGESKPEPRDYLWALLVSAVGDRPLGLQASQVIAVARWLRGKYPAEPSTLCALGPRTSTVALVAAALEEQTIGRIELRNAFPSLKAVIQQNHSFEEMPEMFCFGLLESFDVEQLRALIAPRPVTSLPAER
jgi:hypothetical protein